MKVFFKVEADGKDGEVEMVLPLLEGQEVLVEFEDGETGFFEMKDVRIKSGKSL